MQKAPARRGLLRARVLPRPKVCAVSLRREDSPSLYAIGAAIPLSRPGLSTGWRLRGVDSAKAGRCPGRRRHLPRGGVSAFPGKSSASWRPPYIARARRAGLTPGKSFAGDSPATRCCITALHERKCTPPKALVQRCRRIVDMRKTGARVCRYVEFRVQSPEFRVRRESPAPSRFHAILYPVLRTAVLRLRQHPAENLRFADILFVVSFCRPLTRALEFRCR